MIACTSRIVRWCSLQPMIVTKSTRLSATMPNGVFSRSHIATASYSDSTTKTLQNGDDGTSLLPRKIGPQCYPHKYNLSMSLSEFNERFQHLQSGAKHMDLISMAGRINRDDKITQETCYILTGEGTKVELVMENDKLKQEWRNELRRGDIVGVTGTPGRGEHGRLQIIPETITLLAPCLHEIPENGQKIDKKTRHAQWYLDLLTNNETRERLVACSKIISFTRNYFTSLGFIEVETPIMNRVAGGASAVPFNIYLNHSDTGLFMRVVPEIYLKMLMVGGIDHIFEIGKQFRSEDADNTHCVEFTSFELYTAYADYYDLMNMTEKYISELVLEIKGTHKVQYNLTPNEVVEVDFTPPFQRISIIEELEKHLRVKFPPPANFTSPGFQEFLDELCIKHGVECSHPRTSPRLLDKLIKRFVEFQCIHPTFIVDYPKIISPLSKEHHSKPRLAERYELLICRTEIVDGNTNLNDPVETRRRFQQQLQEKEIGDEEVQTGDPSFFTALEYGVSPSAGWGIGIDRLCMILTNAPNIEEVKCFPKP